MFGPELVYFYLFANFFKLPDDRDIILLEVPDAFHMLLGDDQEVVLWRRSVVGECHVPLVLVEQFSFCSILGFSPMLAKWNINYFEVQLDYFTLSKWLNYLWLHLWQYDKKCNLDSFSNFISSHSRLFYLFVLKNLKCKNNRDLCLNFVYILRNWPIKIDLSLHRYEWRNLTKTKETLSKTHLHNYLCTF